MIVVFIGRILHWTVYIILGTYQISMRTKDHRCSSCAISSQFQDVTPALLRERALYQSAAKAAREGAVLHSLYRLTLESRDEAAALSTTRMFLIGQGNGGGGSSSDGGGGLAAFAAEATAQCGAPLVPWGAVACPLDSVGELSLQKLFLWIQIQAVLTYPCNLILIF